MVTLTAINVPMCLIIAFNIFIDIYLVKHKRKLRCAGSQYKNSWIIMANNIYTSSMKSYGSRMVQGFIKCNIAFTYQQPFSSWISNKTNELMDIHFLNIN
jgi:hypothetical protein